MMTRFLVSYPLLIVPWLMIIFAFASHHPNGIVWYAEMCPRRSGSCDHVGRSSANCLDPPTTSRDPRR